MRGGLPGGAGSVHTGSGEALHPKRQQRIPGGERVVLRLPGGGGHGDPFEREPARVTRDVEDGLLSAERARDVYGVVLKEGARPDTYTVDAEATARHRKEATPDTDA
jgi:N-methylhydantoinase B